MAGVRKQQGRDAVARDPLQRGRRASLVDARRCTRAFEEDEHVFFVATLPTSALTLSLRIESGGATFDARWTRPPASSRAPEWWKKRRALHGVRRPLPRGARRPRRADAVGERSRQEPRSARPSRRHPPIARRPEGARRERALPHAGARRRERASLRRRRSAHRRSRARRRGARTTRSCATAAARDIAIIQDFSFAHAGVGFPPYDDVRAHGRASRFAPLFVWKDDALVHYGKRTDAPLLDLENAGRAGARPRRRRVLGQARRARPAPRHDRRGPARARAPHPPPLPRARPGRHRARRGRPAARVALALRGRRRRRDGLRLPRDRHGSRVQSARISGDRVRAPHAARSPARRGRAHVRRCASSRRTIIRRLATLAAESGMLARLPLAYALLATWSGVPMLLYGEELGLRSGGATRDLEDVWPDRMPMPWTPGHGSTSLRALVRELLVARAGSKALLHGDTTLLFADESTLVYRREAEGEVVDVALNFSDEPKSLELEDDERPRLSLLAAAGACEIAGSVVRLPPFGALVGASRARARSGHRARARAAEPRAARRRARRRAHGARGAPVAVLLLGDRALQPALRALHHARARAHEERSRPHDDARRARRAARSPRASGRTSRSCTAESRSPRRSCSTCSRRSAARAAPSPTSRTCSRTASCSGCAPPSASCARASRRSPVSLDGATAVDERRDPPRRSLRGRAEEPRGGARVAARREHRSARRAVVRRAPAEPPRARALRGPRRRARRRLGQARGGRARDRVRADVARVVRVAHRRATRSKRRCAAAGSAAS